MEGTLAMGAVQLLRKLLHILYQRSQRGGGGIIPPIYCTISRYEDPVSLYLLILTFVSPGHIPLPFYFASAPA